MKRMTLREAVFASVGFTYGILVGMVGMMHLWIAFGCFIILYILIVPLLSVVE